jgi:hypothetical protein
MYPARAAAPTAADALHYLLAVVVEGTQEEPPRNVLISAIARYRDWPVGELAVESVEMTLLDLRLDYPEPETLAKMPLKKSWSASQHVALRRRLVSFSAKGIRGRCPERHPPTQFAKAST